MATTQSERQREDDDDVPDGLHGSNLTAKTLREKIWRPANEQNNWRVFVIVGREGSGKSLTCASILERCDPTFTPERVHFDPMEFMETIKDPQAGAGTAAMIDEAGVGMGVRSWYEKDQILLNKALQTARDDNMIIGMTLPRVEELDSQTEGRLHYFLEMRSVAPGDHARFKFQKWDPTRDGRNKTYRENMRHTAGGRQLRVQTLGLGPPSDGFVEAYEAKKHQFKQDLYDEVLEEYDDEPDEIAEASEQDLADRVKEDGLDDVTSIHGGWNKPYIDADRIKMKFDISGPKANRVKKLLESDEEVSVTDE
jgi:hypothetical protein